jgi:hypothetical protein
MQAVASRLRLIIIGWLVEALCGWLKYAVCKKYWFILPCFLSSRKINSYIRLSCVCVSVYPLQFSTDSHEIWYEYHAIGGHPVALVDHSRCLHAGGGGGYSLQYNSTDYFPVTTCFHANSWNTSISVTLHHSLVYLMICVNCYTVLWCYTVKPLSFPDNSFFRIRRPISVVPERIIFQPWLPHLLFSQIHCFFYRTPDENDE